MNLYPSKMKISGLKVFTDIDMLTSSDVPISIFYIDCLLV